MPSPLSFCMVTTFYPPYHFGGDAMYVYRLSNALARRGHRVTVIHNVDAYRVLNPKAPKEKYFNLPGVTVHALESRFGRLSPLVTYFSGHPGLLAAAIEDIFARQHFDVVHFHNISLMGGPGVLRYGEGRKLYTMHEHWLVCPMHDLWKNDRELCEQRACVRCSLTYRRPPQLWRYTNLLSRELEHVDVFLSPSRSAIVEHQRRGFPYPIEHLPAFLPLPEAQAPEPVAAPKVLQARKPYFLFVGRLVKRKGAQTLIEAFRHYRAADLVIAGDGEYEPVLKRLATDLDHVHFLGRVHPSELPELYAEAIAVLIPSLVYETFGLATLEALTEGTPVIARDLGATGEVARESGGAITYRTQAQLLEAMEALRADPDLRAELGERGHRVSSELWSEKVHLANYLAVAAGGSSTRSPVSAE